MFSIKKTIRKLIKWAVTDSDSKVESSYTNSSLGSISMSKSSGPARADLDASRGIHFTVFPATGGKVIQVSTYDPRTDRSTNSLYVVTNEDELGEELAQIITRESLTR